MRVKIKPSTAFGTVNAPPSKSMAHRLLIAASLSNGSSVTNLAYSNDIKATLSCLTKLGAFCEEINGGVTIGGLNPFNLNSTTINSGESGSTIRFLLPLCLLSENQITLKGAPSLLNRPFSVYKELCNEKDLYFYKGDDSITVKGPLKSGVFNIKADVSSQFISGLMFALPLLNGESEIILNGKTESRSYIDLTVFALSLFNIEIIEKEEGHFYIKGNQNYRSTNQVVEGDFSNAAFLDAFNLFGGNVTVNGLNNNSIQGDKVYLKHFKSLNNEKSLISLADCPDLGPILFTVAAAKHGAVFSDYQRLKIKESDRIECMKTELSKFGVNLSEKDGLLYVECNKLVSPNQALNGHNDHRIVMALSLLCSIVGGEIEGYEAVKKSFPDYFSIIGLLGIEVEEI